MDHEKQIEQFATELDKLVDRFADEYDLPFASIVGVLALKKHVLMEAWQQDAEEDDE